MNKEQIDLLIKNTECIPSIQIDLDKNINNLKKLEEYYNTYTKNNDLKINEMTDLLNLKADKILFEKLQTDFTNHKSSIEN